MDWTNIVYFDENGRVMAVSFSFAFLAEAEDVARARGDDALAIAFVRCADMRALNRGWTCHDKTVRDTFRGTSHALRALIAKGRAAR